MNRFSVALVVSATLALSGCAATQAVFGGTSISQSAPSAMNAAKKGLTAAHLLHEAAADAAKAAATSGLLRGSNASIVQTYLDQSEAMLAAGDQAITLGDAQTAEDKISSAMDLISKVEALAGHGG